MSAVEEIQAAIEKLTALRTRAEEGPFMFLKNEGDINGDLVMGHPNDPVEAYPVVAQELHPADAALIITLHDTIDAQLTILQGEVNFCLMNGWFPASNKVDLARAINGASE